jgi:outer membrane protein assembly factor BamB
VPWTDERSYLWSVQTAVDRGQVDQKPGSDPFHANALEWHPEDPEGPSYWISTKSAHQIYRLDPATGDVTFRIGVGGDFQLLETDGTPAPDSRWFYGQHAPEAHLETDGTWTVTVYDNGGGRPVSGPRFSRVLALQVDVGARTARLLWEWLGDGWYEPVFGDVDVLPDGRVLVTRGHCPQCGGVAEVPGAVLVLDPTTLTESWSLSTGDPDHSLYRAAPLDPCVVAPDNETTCP